MIGRLSRRAVTDGLPGACKDRSNLCAPRGCRGAVARSQAASQLASSLERLRISEEKNASGFEEYPC
eukprot:scaffold315523_cov23-Prasinocladus_malaysianus.AAC.2